MKFPRKSTTIFLIGLFFAIWIDIPHIPLKANIGAFKVNTALSPLSFNFTFYGKPIKKQFETKLGLDLSGGSHLVFDADTASVPQKDREQALEATRNIIERRINFFGVSEPQIQTIKSADSYRIIVDLPGIENVKEAVALIGATAQLDFREEDSEKAPEATDTPVFAQLTKKTKLSGKHVKRASVQFDQTGKPAVGIEFDKEGEELFSKITKRNVGKQVGIFLDSGLISAPVVQQEITGGEAIITGSFTIDQAKQLSIAINSGALPVSIKLVEQRNIGPSLGAAQVEKSIFAGVVGLFSVILFMILYYGRLGILATVALIIYGLISYAIFRAIPVVLTLPGVAGFILSIGMAVDANILIFERIKEEIRRGKTQDIAARVGFGKAIDAIKDANITTLLVAFILFNPLNWSFFPQFGLIKGFALTLAIGVATSLFTGVVITKRLLETFYIKQK